MTEVARIRGKRADFHPFAAFSALLTSFYTLLFSIWSPLTTQLHWLGPLCFPKNIIEWSLWVIRNIFHFVPLLTLFHTMACQPSKERKQSNTFLCCIRALTCSAIPHNSLLSPVMCWINTFLFFFLYFQKPQTMDQVNTSESCPLIDYSSPCKHYNSYIKYFKP